MQIASANILLLSQYLYLKNVFLFCCLRGTRLNCLQAGVIHKLQELPIKVFQKHASPSWNIEKCMLLPQTRKQSNSVLWVIEQDVTAEKLQRL